MRYFKHKNAQWIARELDYDDLHTIVETTVYAEAGVPPSYRDQPFELVEHLWEEISETEALLLALEYA